MEKFELICGKSYGTKAQDIYLKCCMNYGWDRSQSRRFAAQQPLYGYRADASGTKDVWFVCHSNFYGAKFVLGSDGKMHERNYIYEDGYGRVVQIDEYQPDEPHPELVYPLRDRITFFKNHKGQYVFAGTFRCAQPMSRSCERSFYKIADDYSYRK